MRFTTVLTALVLATAIFAADKERENRASLLARIGDLGKASPAPQAKEASTRFAASSGSGVRAVVATNSTIQPGSFMDYGQVSADFGGAESLAVSISSSAPNSNLGGATILVAWAGPGEFFVVTDFIKGSSLVFSEQGGGKVPVYGPGLRLLVANDGNSPITIKQLAVYAYVH